MDELLQKKGFLDCGQLASLGWQATTKKLEQVNSMLTSAREIYRKMA
jgi:hypothetical protein